MKVKIKDKWRTKSVKDASGYRAEGILLAGSDLKVLAGMSDDLMAATIRQLVARLPRRVPYRDGHGAMADRRPPVEDRYPVSYGPAEFIRRAEFQRHRGQPKPIIESTPGRGPTTFEELFRNAGLSPTGRWPTGPEMQAFPPRQHGKTHAAEARAKLADMDYSDLERRVMANYGASVMTAFNKAVEEMAREVARKAVKATMDQIDEEGASAFFAEAKAEAWRKES